MSETVFTTPSLAEAFDLAKMTFPDDARTGCVTRFTEDGTPCFVSILGDGAGAAFGKMDGTTSFVWLQSLAAYPQSAEDRERVLARVELARRAIIPAPAMVKAMPVPLQEGTAPPLTTANSLGSLPLVFSHIPDVFGNTIQQWKITWAEARAKFTDPQEYANKKACPLFKLASFGDIRTGKGSLRSDENLDKIYGIEADYDGGLLSVDQAGDMLASVGIEAMIYTSASHSEPAPRWRVVAPLSTPCARDERRALVAILNEALGGILSPESFTASQSYYYGRVKGVPFRSRHVVGATLDMFIHVMDGRFPESSPTTTTRKVQSSEHDDFGRLVAINNITLETIADLRLAIDAVNPRRAVERSSWITGGQALKSIEQGGFADEALELWLQFSARAADAYDEDDARARWDGFSPNLITYKTIFQWAKEDHDKGALCEFEDLVVEDIEPVVVDNSQAHVIEYPAPFRGVMAEAVDAALRVATKPQPELSLMSVLIGMAAATPGNYALPGGMRLNLYGCNIAGTGEGKDMPRQVANRLVAASKGALLGRPASGQGLEDALIPKTGSLVELDELAHLFAAMNGGKAPSHLVELASVLLRLFSESKHSYYTRRKATTTSVAPPRTIDNPVVSILGSSTPEKLGEAVGTGNIEDGLLGRFLFAWGRSEVVPRRTDAQFTLTENIETKAQMLAQSALFLDQNDHILIRIQPDAKKHLEDMLLRVEQRRKGSSSTFARVLLTRSEEKAERVAGVLAVWDAPNKPVVTVEHVEWAERFLIASDAALIRFTSDFMHGGQIQADASLVSRTLGRILDGDIRPQRANASKYIKNGAAPWSEVLRASKLDKKRMDTAVDHLLELGDVVVKSDKVEHANGSERRVKLICRGAE